MIPILAPLVPHPPLPLKKKGGDIIHNLFKTQEVSKGDNNVKNLANKKLEVICSGANQVLSEFQLMTVNGSTIKYKYSCLTHSAVVGGLIGGSTSWSATGNDGSTEYLDRQTVSCLGEYGIRSFVMKWENKKIRYDYTCIKVKTRTCTEINTAQTDAGSKNEVVFLDRQNVKANKGEYINSFGMKRAEKNTKYFYKIKSCSIKNPPAPVVNIVVDTELKTKNTDNQSM